MNRTEFPNLAIVHVLLKNYLGGMVSLLESDDYPTPADKLEAVRNMASDDGNDEIVSICDYLERKNLVETFFPS